jgi:hypothetical protein
MIWSENARFYALGSVLFAAGGYLMLRKEFIGPAILLWSTATCFAIVASPRAR